MTACGTVAPDALVGTLLAATECQTMALARDGWQGLAGSGLFAALLTGLLTLAVAREGYRLLGSGGQVLPAEAAALLLRFGIVIALSSSWPAYNALVHRVAMEGPGEVANIVFPAAGLDTAALAGRLANAYTAIAIEPSPDPDTAPAANAGTPAPNPEMQRERPGGDGLPGSSRATASGILVVTGAGPWIAARLVLALLLAIGPLAIVAALFEVSIGFTIGWFRALVGAALATLVIPLSLSLELQMLVGPVTAALKARSIGVPGVAPILWIFALANFALLIAVQRVAGGIALPRRRPAPIVVPQETARAAPGSVPSVAIAPAVPLAAPVPVAPSRALAIARAAEARVVAHRGPAGATGGAGSSVPALTVSPGRAPHLAHGADRAAHRRTFSGKRLELGS